MPSARRTQGNKSKPTRRRVALPVSNSINEAVIATDINGTVVFWNSVAERMYGWKWHEAIGRSSTELTVPDSAQPAAANIMDQLRKGEPWKGDFTLRRRDGTHFVAGVTVRPMQDDQGNLVGMIGISHPKSEPPRRKKRASA